MTLTAAAALCAVALPVSAAVERLHVDEEPDEWRDGRSPAIERLRRFAHHVDRDAAFGRRRRTIV